MNPLEELQALEAVVDNAQVQIYEALQKIKEERLFPDNHLDFNEYLKVRFDKSRSWFNDLRDSYNALTKIEMTMPFKNKYAQRTFRKSQQDIRQAVYNRAVTLATSYGDDEVTAAHIRSVTNTTTSILDSGGYADDGSGSMTAADAQINTEYQEHVLRQKTHIMNGRQWEKFQHRIGNAFVFPGMELGQEIEILWRPVTS